MFKKGFTLIEMLIVMAVVSILIAIIIPSYRGMQNDAWTAKAEKEVQTIQVAIESYYRHNNVYPDTLLDLTNSAKARPMIITRQLDDPWKTAADGGYAYVKGNVQGFGDYYIVYSQGMDGKAAVDYAAITTPEITLPADSDDVVMSNLPVTKQK